MCREQERWFSLVKFPSYAFLIFSFFPEKFLYAPYPRNRLGYLQKTLEMYQVKTMWSTVSLISVSELWPFVFLCLFCNLHFCTPHNSFTVYDIFMQVNSNVY